jgi:phosphoglycolate phosphatase-like HAD superfamily hydrolase
MIYLFDLDITLWDTADKHGNSIWAKQLLPPYYIKDDIITDDVYSKCTLRKGVKEYLEYLRSENHEVGFVSSGRYADLPFDSQPSIHMLKLFKIYDYFNGIHILEYKTYNKAESIGHVEEEIVFYDDSIENLNALSFFKNVTAINSIDIRDWTTLIGKHYD